MLVDRLVIFDMTSILEDSKSRAASHLRHVLAPEPKEFLFYVLICILSVIIPTIVLILQSKIKERFDHISRNPYLYSFSELFLLIVIFIMILSFFFTSYAGQYLSGLARDPSYTELTFTPSLLKLSFLSFLLIPFIALSYVSIKHNDKNIIFKILEYLTYPIIFLIFLVTEYDNPDKFHFAFVVDSLVFAQKGLLFSEMNAPQYGLYSLFLLPFFSIINLSVINLSILFSMLNVLVIFLIYQSLKKIFSRNHYYIFFVMFSIIFMSIISNRFLNLNDWDHYFQFSPIRTLFPAMCIYLFVKFDKFSSVSYTLSFFILSFGLFWNFETGFIVVITYLISEVYRSILNRKFKEIFYKIFLGSIALSLGILTSVVLFSPYFSDNIFSFLHPIYAYAGLGLVLVPMRVFGEQLMILIPYCISIFISIIILFNKGKEQRITYYFFFSILGLGIFPYYLGRSVGFNLYSIFYPFIILCGLFFYDFIKMHSLRKYISANITFMISTLFIFMPIALSSFSPRSYLYMKHIARGYDFINNYDKTKLNAPYYNFVNQNTQENEPVLVYMRWNTHEMYINTHISIPTKFVYEYHIHLRSQEDQFNKTFKDGLNKKIITTKKLFNKIPYKEKYEIENQYDDLLILTFKK